jgi:hypothetical protein
MTAAERQICETLAARYPESASAKGGSELRLRIASSFPELSRARPDERENFLEAAERLEKDGIVNLVWERFRAGEELRAIVLSNPADLFARLNKSFPVSEAALAREAACAAATAANAANETDQASLTRTAPFFNWLAENITAADVPPESAPGELARLVADLATLTQALAQYAPGGILAGITPRALSIKLFADSKKIERVIEASRALFRRAERAEVAPPDLSPVARNYPDTLVAGSLTFRLADGSALANESGLIVGLPLVSARRVASVEPSNHASATSPVTTQRPQLLAVENKETFYALAASANRPTALLYVGGHPNAAVQHLIRVFARSGFSLSHAGDLDVEGILILQELIDAAGAVITPVRMDATTFDRYAAHTRPLEDNALKRVAGIRDATRALPGIENLLERILSTGRGLEQEVIGYDE